MSAPDYDAIEALYAAAEIDGRLSAGTTGVAGGDHWYILDANESIAHVSASDGEDEELRQPRAELIVTAVNALPALIARCRELEAKVVRVEAVIESPYWGTYWGEVMVPQTPLRAALRGEGE